MNSDIFSDLICLARKPDADTEQWLEDAEQGVKFLRQTYETGEDIFLYASGPHFVAESVLVPRAAIDPPDHEDLAGARVVIDDTWHIQGAYGGNDGHQVSLQPPLSSPGCNTLVGGEKLVFLRSFEGMQSHQPEIEISQKFVHSQGLFYMDEHNAYCQLNRHGDIERVVTVLNENHADSLQAVRAVIVRRRDLAIYMAQCNAALVTKFDFTRFMPECITSWEATDEIIHDETRDMYYRSKVIPNHASYANGHIVFRPKLSKRDLTDKWKKEEDRSTKQYATFKIHDFKNRRLTETSCGPDHIVSYFAKSYLPWEMSPAFFRPAVLAKYKHDPEKYKFIGRSISCRGAWCLQTYNMNDAGQVQTYVRYLATLPFEEQQYWASFNEWPKTPISKHAKETDFLGKWTTADDPLAELKEKVRSLDQNPPDWWSPRGKELVEGPLEPVTDSIKEWGDEILALDHLVIEGFRVKGLRSALDTCGATFKQEWGSLKLLEVALASAGKTEDAKRLVEPLRKLRGLRNQIAHGYTRNGRAEEVRKARKAHGGLRKHFRDLLVPIRDSL
ncbi:hypothetical protein [Candidatus Foliamicus sp.]